MATLDFTPYCLDKELWHDWGDFIPFHYTGHTHYRSPYECDDNCGTCDGARCDSCHKVYDDRFELSYDYNFIDKVMKEQFNIDDNEKIWAIYDRGHYFDTWAHFPKIGEIEEKYPEFYKELLGE